MARTTAGLTEGGRFSDKFLVGCFAGTFPMEAVLQALEKADKETQRSRELPNHVVVYYAVLMAMYPEQSNPQILQCHFDSPPWLDGPHQFKITGRSGISQARTRVGSEPLKNLFHSVAVPLAQPHKSKHAFYNGLRIVAIDGSTFEVADTPENWEAFLTAKNGGGAGSYPLVRIVG